MPGISFTCTRRLSLFITALVLCSCSILGQLIKITDSPFEVGQAVALTETKYWRAGQAEPVWCVSDGNVANLRFSCPDCNQSNTEEYNFVQEIQRTTRDESANVKFTGSVIKLDRPRLTPDIHGRTLRCEGTIQGGSQQSSYYRGSVSQTQNGYIQGTNGATWGQNDRAPSQQQSIPQTQFYSSQFTSNGQQQLNGNGVLRQTGYSEVDNFDPSTTARVDARIRIIYLKHPKIVNHLGAGPVVTADGNIFYLRQGDSISLKCFAEGNPTPTAFKWEIDGKTFGQQQQIQLPFNQYIRKSLMCSADNGALGPEVGGYYSHAVKLEPFETPEIKQTNFQQGRVPGLDGSGKIRMGGSITLECMATGQPEPTIFWRHNTLDNAVCQQGPNGQVSRMPFSAVIPGAAPQYAVSSTCTVPIQQYTQAGAYWCQACNAVAEGLLECTPKAGPVPQYSVMVDVLGPPQVQSGPSGQGYWSVDVKEAMSGNKDVTITVVFCSDPVPQSQDVWWEIGKDRLNLNERVGHFQAFPATPNGTFPDCFRLLLVISSLDYADAETDIFLNVKNTYGTLRQQIILPDIPGMTRSSSIGLALGLGIGLTSLLIILIIICVACYYFGVCCFNKSPEKAHRNASSRTFAAPGFKSLKPQQLRPEPTGPQGRYSPPSHVTTLPQSGGYKNGLSYSQPAGKAPTPADDSFGSSEKSSGGDKTSPILRPHEGVTYAELDLLKETKGDYPGGPKRPPRYNHPPSSSYEYKRLPQQAPVYQDTTVKVSNSSIV